MNPYSETTVSTFAGISTATITMVLLKMGLRNVWIRGSGPLRQGQPRAVGPAFTMRFIPGREDRATPEALSSSRSTRHAIEDMPAGCIAVVGADGCRDAGVLGDILCARMRVRGVAAIVTDGVVRDRDGVLDVGLPVWGAGSAAPPSIAAMTFADWQQPIGCGGVAIFPGDLVVADGDGAVVVPQDHVEQVAAQAGEQEALEDWILNEVKNGVELPGLYPPNAENLARFHANKGKSN